MYYGSFTVGVDAETEEERDRQMKVLKDYLSYLPYMKDSIYDGVDINGFEYTEHKWDDEDSEW